MSEDLAIFLIHNPLLLDNNNNKLISSEEKENYSISHNNKLKNM